MEEFLQFKQVVVENWPAIVQYALMFVAYFLVFLFRAKTNGTKRDLTAIFKDTANAMTQSEAQLEQKIDTDREYMRKELEESKALYDKAVTIISSFDDKISRLEGAMNILVEEATEDGECITSETT